MNDGEKSEVCNWFSRAKRSHDLIIRLIDLVILAEQKATKS